MAKINATAQEAAASKARTGIPCRIPSLARDVNLAAQVDAVLSQCGGKNCHVDVEFDDGITWLARIRLDDPLHPPSSVQASIFLSEVATLQFLADTKVPTPQVYAYELESPENAVGTSYVLMEKLPGKPLDRNRVTRSMYSTPGRQCSDWPNRIRE